MHRGDPAGPGDGVGEDPIFGQIFEDEAEIRDDEENNAEIEEPLTAQFRVALGGEGGEDRPTGCGRVPFHDKLGRRRRRSSR